MVEQPAWLRRGRVPGAQGQVCTVLERRLLRVLCQVADDDGWCGKTHQLLADLAGEHRTSVDRQIVRFIAWGILVPEAREVGGRLRQGVRVLPDQIRPRPREQTVDMGEYRRMKARVRELEARLAAFQAFVQANGVTAVPDEAGALRRFAAGLGRSRCHFLELPSSVGQERIYGEPGELQAVIDAGASGRLGSEPLWPSDRGVVPIDVRSMEQPIGHRLRTESEASLELVLRWYRADLADDPAQLSWFGPQTLTRDNVWNEVVKRAHAARARHAERLRALLRQIGPDRRILLTTEVDRVMCPIEQEQLEASLAIAVEWEQRRASGA